MGSCEIPLHLFSPPCPSPVFSDAFGVDGKEDSSGAGQVSCTVRPFILGHTLWSHGDFLSLKASLSSISWHVLLPIQVTCELMTSFDLIYPLTHVRHLTPAFLLGGFHWQETLSG